MQLDLQSVEKYLLSTFAPVFAPKMLRIGIFLASEWVGVSTRSIQNYFSASAGAQLQEIAVSTFFIQLGQIRLQSPDRTEKNFVFLIRPRIVIVLFFAVRSGMAIVFDLVWSKKCWRRFPATGPLQKRETALDGFLEKTPTHSEARKRPIFNIFGAKAHANVLESTFSTGCQYGCVRLGVCGVVGWGVLLNDSFVAGGLITWLDGWNGLVD